MDRVTVTITKWDKYNPRKDFKTPVWFALSNRILEDPDLFDLDPLEFKAFIYILCQASQRKSATVELRFLHADRVSNLKQSVILRVIEKLERIGILKIVSSLCTEGTQASVLHTTGQDITRQDSTNSTEDLDQPEIEKEKEPINPRVLVEIWNSDRGPLSEVEKLTEERKAKAKAQLAKYPDIAHWRLVLSRWKKSKFCTEKWRPTFDDWLKEPKRIATLEGRYDDRSEPSKPPPGPKPIQYAPAESVYMPEHAALSDEERQAKAQELRSILGRIGSFSAGVGA